jgi:magnesium transporter
MNFHNMPELDKPWAYPTMIVVVIAVVGGIYAWLRKSRWL